jgi:hypothetical protein
MAWKIQNVVEVVVWWRGGSGGSEVMVRFAVKSLSDDKLVPQ